MPTEGSSEIHANKNQKEWEEQATVDQAEDPQWEERRKEASREPEGREKGPKMKRRRKVVIQILEAIMKVTNTDKAQLKEDHVPPGAWKHSRELWPTGLSKRKWETICLFLLAAYKENYNHEDISLKVVSPIYKNRREAYRNDNGIEEHILKVWNRFWLKGLWSQCKLEMWKSASVRVYATPTLCSSRGERREKQKYVWKMKWFQALKLSWVQERWQQILLFVGQSWSC